jgi:S1-C subfamily serine protease
MLRRHSSWLAPLAAAIVAGGIVAAISLGGSTTVAKKQPRLPVAVRPAQTFQESLRLAVKAVFPSVVLIETSGGLGSGVVFDDQGHIVTNAHVVGTAKTFTVTTPGGKEYKATLVGSFPPDDLAVIKVSGATLKPALFGDSSILQIGDIALAIGNPLGLKSSVTMGIVSARRGAVPEGSGITIPTMIQTSADINPGNSGGALASIDGRVVGIPTLAARDPLVGGPAPGIGFAIPSNLVKDIAGQLVKYGKVVDSHRAYLGVRVGDTGGKGVYVAAVEPGAPAAKAGIRPGDVIVSIAGKPTPTTDVLGAVLATLKPGATVDVVVRHQDGKKATLRVKLGTLPGG